MTVFIVFIACVATAVAAAASTSVDARRAVLRLVDRDPLAVKGEGFKPRERVRVYASEGESARLTGYAADAPERRIRANANGVFRVVFPEITLDRCSMVRVVAVRSQGRQVVLKQLPAPMCAPMRAP